MVGRPPRTCRRRDSENTAWLNGADPLLLEGNGQNIIGHLSNVGISTITQLAVTMAEALLAGEQV